MTPNPLLKDGRYLPEPLRDFHDQKTFFKMLFTKYAEDLNSPERQAYLRGIDWVSAHVFTIDFFLYVMAKYGYTLQKSRIRNFNCFYDLTHDLQEFRTRSVKLDAETIKHVFGQQDR